MLYDRINDNYLKLNGTQEHDESIMDIIFLLKDEILSLKEIKSICETRGRY